MDWVSVNDCCRILFSCRWPENCHLFGIIVLSQNRKKALWHPVIVNNNVLGIDCSKMDKNQKTVTSLNSFLFLFNFYNNNALKVYCHLIHNIIKAFSRFLVIVSFVIGSREKGWYTSTSFIHQSSIQYENHLMIQMLRKIALKPNSSSINIFHKIICLFTSSMALTWWRTLFPNDRRRHSIR